MARGARLLFSASLALALGICVGCAEKEPPSLSVVDMSVDPDSALVVELVNPNDRPIWVWGGDSERGPVYFHREFRNGRWRNTRGLCGNEWFWELGPKQELSFRVPLVTQSSPVRIGVWWNAEPVVSGEEFLPGFEGQESWVEWIPN